MERNLRFKTRPILRPYSVVHGLLVMCERAESPGSLLLGWVEEKKERKKFVQIELHAQNKIRTKKNTLNCKYYQDLVPFFNFFAKIHFSASICEYLDLYVYFDGL